ncbi:ABC 3 transport family protein [delta proteobacterium NaphS2]|nr:ABC 3 transport family protein [delta proteobacterium NaphS2]
MWEALQYDFMRNALLAGLLVSISCGIIGSLVVVNRIVFISGGIAHAAFGGVGLGFFYGFSPFLGAAAFASGASLIMGAVSLKNKHRADTIIGVLWAIGMAVGIILIDLTPGYHVDLMSYLFGSILAVPSADLWLMLPLDGFIFLAVLFFYKEFVALSYDEEFAFVMGVPVKTLYLLLLGMTAFSIVMIIRVVGLILVIALLTIPPFIAEKYTRSLGHMMLLSSILSICFTFLGLWLSYVFDITSGATIILVAGVGFFFSQILNFIKGKVEIPFRKQWSDHENH